jgi:hypothetical protein
MARYSTFHEANLEDEACRGYEPDDTEGKGDKSYQDSGGSMKISREQFIKEMEHDIGGVMPENVEVLPCNCGAGVDDFGNRD